MALLPHCNTISATVDTIHRRVGYAGGKLRLADVFDAYPGFELVEVDRARLPHGASAALIRSRGIATIAIDATQPRKRLRFSLAHEVGHAMLHAGHVREFRLAAKTRRGDEILERQANYFASELLVPMWALDRALPRRLRVGALSHSAPRPVLLALADRFDVSLSMMAIQFAAYASLRATPLGQASA